MKKKIDSSKIAPAASKAFSVFVRPGMFYNKA
jgi:hypothetical protein